MLPRSLQILPFKHVVSFNVTPILTTREPSNFSDQLSFGVGRLVGSPVTRSSSPSHSPGADSLKAEHQDVDVDVDVEEDEEVDVDVEEVGEEDEREGTFSPTRSASPPLRTTVMRGTSSSHPPKR